MTHTKSKYSKPKFLATFAAVIAILAGVSHLFGFGIKSPAGEGEHLAALTEDESPFVAVDTILVDETDSDMPLTDSLAIEDDSTSASAVFTSSKVWSYPDCFPDSNSVQMVAACRNGVAPMRQRSEVLACASRNQLSNICSSPYYIVDDLTHSMPYLVPKAQTLLNTIGINFVDSLRSKHLPLHLPIVTSVLRTSDDIRRLQSGNGNSISNSCHCYGTTVDITYHRFMPLDGHRETRYDDTLKKVLAEVLYDLRIQGRCYVKYERRQACFHLTVL